MGNKYSFGVALQNTQRCFGYCFGLGTPSLRIVSHSLTLIYTLEYSEYLWNTAKSMAPLAVLGIAVN